MNRHFQRLLDRETITHQHLLAAGRGHFARKDLEACASYLVKAGYAQRQGKSVGFKPDGWAKLRERDASLALQTQLGISGMSLVPF